jgi:hypothetical protein
MDRMMRAPPPVEGSGDFAWATAARSRVSASGLANAAALFYRLQAPGTDEDGVDPEEKTRRVVAQVREIFGLETDDEYFAKKKQEALIKSQASQQGAGSTEEEEEEEFEEISPEEEARERARQLLENILTRQVELCEAKRKAILKESLAGPSAYERAAEFALAHPDAALMQRMEESSFRQIWRITNLLMKVKHQAPAEESR